MDPALHRLLPVTLVIFMIGSLMEVGLKLRMPQAAAALRDSRFIGLSLLWAFVLCPALAVGLARLLSLAPGYAVGLILLGLAPCAPFLPMVAAVADGDLAYVAAFILLAAVGTVIGMPLLTPLLLPGFAAGAWTIVRPLLVFILLPLAAGAIVRARAPGLAEAAHPRLRRITAIDTLAMLALVLWLYRADIVSAFGTRAIAAQVLFYAVVAAASFASSPWLPPPQRSVLALGCCTRNLGAAFAPLMAPGTDPRAIAMIAIAVPLSVACGFGAAACFRKAARCGGISA